MRIYHMIDFILYCYYRFTLPWDQPYRVGLQKLALQQFIARGLNRHGLENTSMFPTVRTRVQKRDRLAVEPWRHPESMLLVRVCFRMVDIFVSRTTQGIPSSPQHSSLPHRDTMCRTQGYIIDVFLSVKLGRIPRFSGLQNESFGQFTQCTREEEYPVQK